MRITNYEFQFFWFFLTDVDMILPKEFCLSGSGGVVMSLSAGRRPTVMKVIAFQAGIQYVNVNNVPMNSL